MPNATIPLAAARSIGGPTFRWLAFAGMSLCIAGLSVSGNAHAQAESPATASDRAKRDADKVYELIRMHADRPRKATPAIVSPPQVPTAVVDVEPTIRPAIAKLTVAPDLPMAETTARAVAFSTAAPGVVALASPAAPARATELTLKQISLPAGAASEAQNVTLVLLSSVEPEFPSHLTRRLGQGSVVVNFEVRPDGSVGATAIEKTRHSGLNAAALAAVAAWRFKPISKPTAGVTELRFE